MIYLPVSLLAPGMVLARDIPSSNPILPLMVAGQTLTARAIRNVTARGIKGIYIEYEASDDVEQEEFIPPEQKQLLLFDIKTEFDKIQRQDSQFNYQVVSKMAESIVMSVLDHDMLLCNVLDIRDYDSYTYSHSLYVGMVGVVLARSLDMPPARLTEIATAGLLHDLGKLDIPAKIVNKGGPLTEMEYEIMKEHPQRAMERLKKRSGYRESVLLGVVTHHEHFDGTGYPRGMTGERIPLYGRILAIADVYDALSSNRSYRRAWSPTQVMDYISSRAGSQFDPKLLGAFLGSISAYPVGTLVKLSDGSVGMVIQNHPELTLRPTVRLLSPHERRLEVLNLAREAFHITVLDVLSDPSDAEGLDLSPSQSVRH